MQPRQHFRAFDPLGGDRQSEPTSDLEFKVELELLPDITMPDFAAIALTRLKAEPPADAIAKIYVVTDKSVVTVPLALKNVALP